MFRLNFSIKKLRIPRTKTIYLKQKKTFYQNLFNINQEKFEAFENFLLVLISLLLHIFHLLKWQMIQKSIALNETAQSKKTFEIMICNNQCILNNNRNTKISPTQLFILCF